MPLEGMATSAYGGQNERHHVHTHCRFSSRRCMHTCANANSCAADSNSNSTPANVNACTADGNAYATNTYCYNHPADSNSNTASDSYASENHRDRAGQPRGLKGTRLLGQEDRLFHSRRESHHQPEWTIV